MNKIKHLAFKNNIGNGCIDFIENLLEKIKDDKISCLGMVYLENTEERRFEMDYMHNFGKLELIGLLEVMRDNLITDLRNEQNE